jgi:protein O-mannosyl-transferase
MKTDVGERLRAFVFNNKLAFFSIIVSVITLIVYLPALNNEFVNWDDRVYIYENDHIRTLDLRFFKWAFFDFHAFNWHPLTWISHAVDYALWGLNPHGHHLFSIVLHGLNSLLVVVIAMRLLEFSGSSGGSSSAERFLSENSRLSAAIITGLMFGLHPVHVESVAWVSERKDMLCAFFFLLSLISYARYVRSKGYDTFRQVVLNKYYLGSLIFFLLALMSKPMAVTLPAVLLILDWHPFGRFQASEKLRTILLEKLPYVVLSLLSAIITVMAQGTAVTQLSKISLFARILIACHSLLSYLWKMFWPESLIPLYHYPRGATIVSYEYLLPPLFHFCHYRSLFYSQKES